MSEPDKGWQILVRLEGPGVDPDRRGALEGWEATPHQQLERLLRETGVPTGLLLTDGELRLIHAPRGETSGWLKFPLRSLGDVGGRPMLGGLKLILSSFRLHNDAPDRRLASSAQSQPRRAGRGFDQARRAGAGRAARAASRPPCRRYRTRIEALAASRPEHLYEGLLTVLLRLVFLLYAEDRDLIPSRTDGEARALYDRAMASARSMPACSTTPRIIPIRWTSAVAHGAACWRSSASSIAATVPAGSAAAAANCSIRMRFRSCKDRTRLLIRPRRRSFRTAASCASSICC